MNSTYVRRFASYFIYAIVFILLIKYGDECYYILQVPGSKYLDMQFLGRAIVWSYLLVYFTVLGLMLAVPRFVSTLKKGGSWYFDWIKFIAVSIPILYVVITPWIPSSWWKWWPLFNYLMGWNNMLSHISVMILGYFLLSSFKKV
jgi:hypothetical protein